MNSDQLDEYQVGQRIRNVIGSLLEKQKTFAKIAKKRNLNPIDKKLNEELASLKLEGAELIKDKMIQVNQPQYLQAKQAELDMAAHMSDAKPQKARLEEYEFLRIMDEQELNAVLLALLPVIKLEEKPPADKCKYMIGTQSTVLMIKTNKIMVRVGGGFATIEEHIRQVGPFECIKIYKLMKGNPDKNEEPMTFKEAVVFYLNKHKTTDRIIKQYMNTDDDEQMGLFAAAIEYLKQRQEEVAKAHHRRGSPSPTNKRASVARLSLKLSAAANSN